MSEKQTGTAARTRDLDGPAPHMRTLLLDMLGGMPRSSLPHFLHRLLGHVAPRPQSPFRPGAPRLDLLSPYMHSHQSYLFDQMLSTVERSLRLRSIRCLDVVPECCDRHLVQYNMILSRTACFWGLPID
jgi:hypothetical protein